MKKSEATRERVLEAGIRMASQCGLTGVSLGPLADEVELSKSGLFAHFESKEALQLALLDYAAEQFQRAVVLPALKMRRGLPRVLAAFELSLDWAERVGLPGGCLFYAAAAELDDQEGPVREHLVAIQEQWLASLRLMARGAVETGELRRGLDTEQFVSELYGILLMLRFAGRLLRDPAAVDRARASFESLVARSRAT